MIDTNAGRHFIDVVTSQAVLCEKWLHVLVECFGEFISGCLRFVNSASLLDQQTIQPHKRGQN